MQDWDYGEQHPHFDGKKEGIISDSVGKQIGIRTEANKESANPFHVNRLKKDLDMERFNKTLK
ncbi:hypothetical protein [Aquibacillus albus]|uniref:Uncharacterized protein n=1 Tax=Aquibacillus albus TaxID=1168171 RepID=A0ABS2N1V5_9BACI|nr:hypothetical protein [Aquibacillus albus]MBM7572111.1 hypothetical protein [Aquibacillus albus]